MFYLVLLKRIAHGRTSNLRIPMMQTILILYVRYLLVNKEILRHFSVTSLFGDTVKSGL